MPSRSTKILNQIPAPHDAQLLTTSVRVVGTRFVRFTILGLIGLVMSLTSHGAAITADARLYVSYNAEPSPSDLAAFDLCILDPAANVDIKAGQALGHTYLAYVSAVEALPGSPNATESVKHEVAIIGKNDAWKSMILDVGNPNWLTMMLDVIVPAALAKGHDGVFLDTLDSASLLPGYSEKTRDQLVALIRGIRTRYPSKKIMINRGFDLLPHVKNLVDAVLVESVFESFDFKTMSYVSVKPSDTDWITDKIKTIQAAGLPVFAIDYVNPTRSDVAKSAAERLRKLGCSPFISTPDLQGLNLGPQVPIARRILVVHGADVTDADWLDVAPPIDTSAANNFQAALEWMGYEFEFHDIGSRPVTEENPTDFAGVILDEVSCQKPITKQTLLTWLEKVKAAKVPILFLGEIPFADDDIRSEFAQAFGLGGELSSVYGIGDVTISHQDAVMMKGETEVKAHKIGFKSLIAPADAETFLSLTATNNLGKSIQFDPFFLADWGGMWLEPYVVLRASQSNRFFYADAYKFLERWLRGPAKFPIPDTTTRDGRRIFYSHIDGDGFASLSHFPGHPACAQVVLDRVLKRYPLPVTVSVVEADTRGLLKTLKREDAPRYEALAKEMFNLPQVQAGSHSYSHPFIWDATDRNPGHYDTTKTTLADDIVYPSVDPRREIAGSIDYINKNLLPTGKKVELMLWSGNCRPGVAALKMCRELGVENMNGGETIISKLYPSISGVGPRLAKWGNELQVFAANQNEFMYANGFAGPNFGGFGNVIETFDLTEKPRRLKPVNVYYHFYSATYLSSQRALEHIHDWCMSQPLHPITALEFCSLVRDAHRTEIYSLGPDHWRIANSGALRTYRMPATAGKPDLSVSNGVIGYKQEGDMLYIHTNGQPMVEIKIVPKDSEPVQWPHLVESSADVSVSKQSRGVFHFSVVGWAPVSITVGGLPPSRECVAVLAGKSKKLTTDNLGNASFTVPAGSNVAFDLPPPYAISN